MSLSSPLKFNNINSFVDTSFFATLADLKLNKLKLDSSRIRIKGFSSHPSVLTKFNDSPIINFDYSSFDSVEHSDHGNNIEWYGYIYNTNTIEEFKNIDKQKMLRKWGEEILENIKRLDSTEDYASFNQVFALTFSDLKKFKFYYWFAFPSIHSPWVQVGEVNHVSPEVQSMIQHEVSNTQFKQFFQLTDDFQLVSGKLNPDFNIFAFVDICNNQNLTASLQLKNYLHFLALKGFKSIRIISYKADGPSVQIQLKLADSFDKNELPKIQGWERSAQGKLGPKLADVGALSDPKRLAEQAVDLNLRLMKWRIAPELNLDDIKKKKVLLLGAGTLGSYVSRTLLGWGIRNFTFVDSGRVSYSNPVRQPLYFFKDCYAENGKGEWKALQAAKALKEIFPDVQAKGEIMEIPMIGHPVDSSDGNAKESFDRLCNLFEAHDVVFLLTDSRESRWLPTVLGQYYNKIVINAALGFDSYLVMRHGNVQKEDFDAQRLGCYYCSDVVAPEDSLSDRTLDQMCTVTRPGVALIASSLAVELYVSLVQRSSFDKLKGQSSLLFDEVPHQIRGFLHNFSLMKLHNLNYKHCSACSDAVIFNFRENGWDFVKNCMNDTKYLEDVCGLLQVQKEAEMASQSALNDLLLDELGLDDNEDFSEWIS